MTQTSNIRYFIDIENSDISPIQIDAWIKTRRNDENTITPKFALEILKRTNHFANIKTVIKEIQKHPIEKQLEYKEFVLSAVSCRIQAEPILEKLCQFAIDSDYLQEFINECTNSKIYFPLTCKTKKINQTETTEKDFSNYDTLVCYSHRAGIASYTIEKCTLPRCASFANLKEISLINNKYDDTKEISFNSISKVSISHQESKFPEELDFTSCAKVNFSLSNLSSLKNFKIAPQSTLHITACTNLPQKMEFQDLTSLYIASCFNTTEELIVNKCHSVSLSSSTRVPKKITIKNCKILKLDAIDFNIKELILENIDHISLCKKQFRRSDSKEIPPKILDLSSCNEIIFQNFPLGKIKELKFGTSHKYVDLQYAKSMPKTLDLSGVTSVCLDHANCKGLQEIKFGENSIVSLKNAINLPKKLDISMCSSVDTSNCDLSNVEEITLTNEDQKIIFLKDNPTFKGKIKYTAYQPTTIDLNNCHYLY